jgi:hypothetical protein
MTRRLLPLIVVLVAACSDRTDLMQSWVGRDASELASVWGQPSEDIMGEDASRTMIYVSYWSSGPFEIQTCRRIFTTDGGGIIRTLFASGC